MMSPGTYLKKRREAAGVGIIQASATLAAFSMAQRLANPRAVIAQRLNDAEADLEPLNRGQLGLIRAQVFRLDIGIYQQLVDLHSDPGNPDLPRPQICRECACSWNDACLVDGGGCAWAEEPTRDRDGLCTRCLRENAIHAEARQVPMLTLVEGAPA